MSATQRPIGQVIQAARIAAELSVAEAANISGISVSAWHRIENGERPDPRMDTLRKIARGLNRSVAELIETAA